MITAQVAPIYIDQLFVDQAVVLQFSALDQSKTPELQGHVGQISTDIFQSDTTKGSYYRVEIALAEGEPARSPKGVTLRPGMPVDAYFKTGGRSTLTYLIQPVRN